jgi:hypothetical protein
MHLATIGAMTCRTFSILFTKQDLISSNAMGLYHPLDGITNLKYKLLYLLTTNQKIQREMHQLLTGIDAAI